MQYLMTPLERHYDGGFGATAEAFFRAAELLSHEKGPHIFFQALPHNFLLRHAVELFLKSGIVIIHRKLDLPFDTQPPRSNPMVQVGGEWRPFFKVHSIASLFAYWKMLINQHQTKLQSLCRYKADWSIPAKLDGWIAVIERTDPGSTYYRYPATRDSEGDKKKSPFKEIPVEELMSESRPEGQWVRALVVTNENGEFVRAYSLDYSTEQESTESLIGAASMLNDFHAMMRIELTEGW